MVSSVNPLVLIFDLDDTIFSTQLEKHTPSPLSKSARNSLSKSDKGQVDNPVLAEVNKDGTTKEVHAHKLTAINREEMSKIFIKIYEVMEASKGKKIKCPIAVKIMTSATYGEKYVKKIFDRFFGEGTDRFTNGDFPIQYFNYEDLNIDTKNYPLAEDARKVALMDKMFKSWQKALKGLKPERVILIDNGNYNIKAIETYAAYTAIHYPTTPKDRSRKQKFSKEGPRALSELMGYISEVEKAVKLG